MPSAKKEKQKQNNKKATLTSLKEEEGSITANFSTGVEFIFQRVKFLLEDAESIAERSPGNGDIFNSTLKMELI